MDKTLIGPLKRTLNLAREIKDQYPEIEKVYDNQEDDEIFTVRDIVELFDFTTEFNVDMKTAMAATTYALSGCKGYDNMRERAFKSFSGLISSRKRLEELAREKRAHNARKVLGKFTKEQKREYSRNSGRACAIMKGYVIWEDNEKETLYEKSKFKKYQHRSGRHKGNPDIKLLSDFLNEHFHNGEEIRTKDNVRRMLYTLRQEMN